MLELYLVEDVNFGIYFSVEKKKKKKNKQMIETYLDDEYKYHIFCTLQQKLWKISWVYKNTHFFFVIKCTDFVK